MKSKIISTIRTFRWQQWLVMAMFLLVAGFTAFKAVNVAREVIFWQAHRDEPIRGWMSVGYVSHSYRVPPELLYLALGLPDNQPDKRPLRKIAHVQHRSMDEIREVLHDAIIHARLPVSTAATATAREKSRSMGVAMNLIDQLLAALLLYGQPALFCVIVIAAVGAPLPVNLMLIAAGSFVEQGQMKLWLVIIVASTAAVSGDQIGYGLARWAGRRVTAWISRKLGGEAKIQKSRSTCQTVGRAGHFLQPLAGDVAGAVAQCDERDRRISLASFHPLGRAGRRALGGFVRDAGLHLQRPRSSYCRGPGLFHLGLRRFHCLGHPGLENNALSARE